MRGQRGVGSVTRPTIGVGEPPCDPGGFFSARTMIYLRRSHSPLLPKHPRPPPPPPPIPEVLGVSLFFFLSLGGQLRGSVCLPLPFDWPGMLERAMSTLIVSNRGWHAVSWEDCLFGKEAGQSQQIEPGEPRAALRERPEDAIGGIQPGV